MEIWLRVWLSPFAEMGCFAKISPLLLYLSVFHIWVIWWNFCWQSRTPFECFLHTNRMRNKTLQLRISCIKRKTSHHAMPGWYNTKAKNTYRTCYFSPCLGEKISSILKYPSERSNVYLLKIWCITKEKAFGINKDSAILQRKRLLKSRKNISELQD